MPKKNNDPVITEAQAQEYDLLAPLLHSVLQEMREFCKKKQDEPLNLLKVRAANKILKRIKALLATEPTAEFLEQLDEDTLPTNSDAVIIMAQYVSSMEKYRKNYYGYDNRHEQRWFTKENPDR